MVSAKKNKPSDWQQTLLEKHPVLTPLGIALIAALVAGFILWFILPSKINFELHVETALTPTPGEKLVVINNGILNANETYTIATGNSVTVDLEYKQYADITQTEDSKIKELKIKNLPRNTPIELTVVGLDEIKITRVGGNTVAFFHALDELPPFEFGN